MIQPRTVLSMLLSRKLHLWERVILFTSLGTCTEAYGLVLSSQLPSIALKRHAHVHSLYIRDAQPSAKTIGQMPKQFCLYIAWLTFSSRNTENHRHLFWIE
jgi:hypothetical protein